MSKKTLYAVVVPAVVAIFVGAFAIGTDMFDYYCSAGSVFLGIDMSSSIYCKPVVYIVHVAIASLVVIVILNFFLSKSKEKDAPVFNYKKSPHTEGSHIGDIVYGNKLVNTQKETENFSLAKSKTEKVKARIVFAEFPQNMSAVPYLSLKLYNHEQDEIEKCYGTLLELENLYTPTVTIPILEMVNPNSKFLSWGGGSPSEQVTIPRGDGAHPGVKVLNIAKGGVDVVFLFHGHESNYHGTNFRAKIKIDGEINGNPIESIVTEFCFKYGVNHYTTRQREPEIGEKQRITIVVTDIKSRFAFEDCNKIWETPMIDGE